MLLICHQGGSTKTSGGPYETNQWSLKKTVDWHKQQWELCNLVYKANLRDDVNGVINKFVHIRTESFDLGATPTSKSQKVKYKVSFKRAQIKPLGQENIEESSVF